jgi:hypothetical protein
MGNHQSGEVNQRPNQKSNKDRAATTLNAVRQSHIANRCTIHRPVLDVSGRSRKTTRTLP